LPAKCNHLVLGAAGNTADEDDDDDDDANNNSVLYIIGFALRLGVLGCRITCLD